jgi:uncharacterized protein
MNVQGVRFEVGGVPIAGNLHLPDGPGPKPALVLDGPLTSVKEQAQGNYARALAERGFVTLAFDHRYFGESGGEPRQYESPAEKIEDILAAVEFLRARAEVDPTRIGAVGVCAGAGYMAGAVARSERLRAWAAVAGFFHDAGKQREWMGEAAFEAALAEAREARRRWEDERELLTIPAVGKDGGRVAMPLAEAYEYYGTPRGAVPSYRNEFALLSRADTLPYDAQSAASKIRIPSLLLHSEKALAPALARKFFDALAGPKSLEWLESCGQVDFYDDPALIAQAADRVALHFS